MESSSGGGTRKLSTDAVPILKEGIALVLQRWSALQMAVDNEWGGRDSKRIAEQLVDDIFTWFTQSKEPLYIDDLEGLLDEAMLSLNTMTEDGSVEEVAERLMIMHEECLEGNFGSIESLREVNPRARGVSHIRQVADDDDDDDSDDDDDEKSMGVDDSSNMMVDEPECLSISKPVNTSVDEPRHKAPAEAEDGWTIVAPRKNRGKGN